MPPINYNNWSNCFVFVLLYFERLSSLPILASTDSQNAAYLILQSSHLSTCPDLFLMSSPLFLTLILLKPFYRNNITYSVVDILYILILHYNIVQYQIHFTMQNLHLLEFLTEAFGVMCSIFNAWRSRWNWLR